MGMEWRGTHIYIHNTHGNGPEALEEDGERHVEEEEFNDELALPARQQRGRPALRTAAASAAAATSAAALLALWMVVFRIREGESREFPPLRFPPPYHTAHTTPHHTIWHTTPGSTHREGLLRHRERRGQAGEEAEAERLEGPAQEAADDGVAPPEGEVDEEEEEGDMDAVGEQRAAEVFGELFFLGGAVLWREGKGRVSVGGRKNQSKSNIWRHQHRHRPRPYTPSGSPSPRRPLAPRHQSAGSRRRPPRPRPTRPAGAGCPCVVFDVWRVGWRSVTCGALASLT